MAPENTLTTDDEQTPYEELKSMIKPYFDPAITTLGMLGEFNRNSQAGAEAEHMAAKNRMEVVYQKFLAGEARAKGKSRARLQNQKTDGDVGRIRAGFGASGVDANFGSAVALARDARAAGDYDAAMIRHEAEMEAAGHDFNAKVAKMNANYYSSLAAMQKRSGILDSSIVGLGGAKKLMGI